MLRPLLLTLLLLAPLTGCGGSPASPQAAAPVPSATLPPQASPPKVAPITAAGLSTLLKNAQGKIVVLNFWATWCPPCVEEMPELARFYNATPRDTVTFLSLSADDPATANTTVQEFLTKHALPFDVQVLAERDPDALTEALRGEISGALPTTLIFNRQGERVLTHDGIITEATLNEAIRPLL